MSRRYVSARRSARVGVAGLVLGGAYALVARGSLTLDVGIGRRVRPLGPLEARIAAPRETVFDVVAAPYLGRTPRALASKLRVLERGEDLVLAEHFTPVGRLTAVTLETVSFERPSRIGFRLVRGPVPHVTEEFALEEVDGSAATRLVYRGELGTDLWGVGGLWGAVVARRWEQVVSASVESIRIEAERRSAGR
ncbi:MAG: SRPBCC family protein [Solirubrobacterales bacterium]